MSESIVLNIKSAFVGSTYLDWIDSYVGSTGSRFQYHADGTPFRIGTKHSVQKINQAEKGKIESIYYRHFSEMKKNIDKNSFSKEGSIGNELGFYEHDKINDGAIISNFKYNSINKLDASHVFFYQNEQLTGRARFVYNSRGEITKSEKFNGNGKLLESNLFSYKKDAWDNNLITTLKEVYHDGDVTSTTHKELYDLSGMIIKSDVYGKKGNHLERNDFSYFRSGEKCQTVKSTFNNSGGVSYKDKMVYKKNGDLFGRIESNYNNEGFLKDSKETYYIESKVSRIIERKYSTDGKTILNSIEKTYDITNARFVNNIESFYSTSGKLKREVEYTIDVNGKISERINKYYPEGVNLARYIKRSYAADKMMDKVDIQFDNNGNTSRIIRHNSEGVIVNEPTNAYIDMFFQGVTQLTDAIHSFSDGERALIPAPVGNTVHGFLGQRNLVPVMKQ